MIPVKNVTWILMEIPCHFMSQIDGSLVDMDTKFHDHSMHIYTGFICFPSSNMIWILSKFNSWNFYGIYKENDGISIGLGLIFDQTAVKKTCENPCHIFYRDDASEWSVRVFSCVEGRRKGKNLEGTLKSQIPRK